MAKKTVANSRITPKTSSRPRAEWLPSHFLLIVIVCTLILLLAFVSLKFMLARSSWASYSAQAQEKILNFPVNQTFEKANTLAAVVVNFPEDEPLFYQPTALAEYLSTYSQATKRDVVVIDVQGTILADSIAENVGRRWTQDKSGEVMLTIQDGKPREFEEISADYPNGLMQVVVPLKDDAGKIIGAVVLSTETVE